MTEADKPPVQSLTTQQRAAIGKSARNGVSGRLKAALDDMVWNATPWEEAAKKANLTVRAMRLAMERPHILAYLRAGRRVRLATMSPKNLQRLGELRDQDDNSTAAVQAAKALEGLASEQLPDSTISVGAQAGFVIDLSEPGGITVRITTPIQRRPSDDAIDVTPNPDEAE